MVLCISHQARHLSITTQELLPAFLRRNRFVILTLVSNRGPVLADTPHESSLVYSSPAHKAALSTPKKVFKDKRETLNPTKYRIRQLEFVKLVTGSLLPTGNAKKGIKRQLNQL